MPPATRTSRINPPTETAGDPEKQAESDLERFKAFIESRGAETGGWRGGVNEGAAVGTPGVDAARASEGDSGKAGLSAKVIAGAAAAAVAGVAAVGAGAAKAHSQGEPAESEEMPAGYPGAVPASPIVEPPTAPPSPS